MSSDPPRREDYPKTPAGTLAWGYAFERYVEGAMKTSEVKIIKANLLAVQICAPAAYPQERIEDEVNRIYPSGTSGGWRVDDQPGVTCAGDSARRHWVLKC